MECVACACSYVSDVIVALLHTFSGRLVVFLSIIRQLITTSIPRCTVTLRQGGGRWRPEVYYLHISEWNVLINIQTREHTHDGGKRDRHTVSCSVYLCRTVRKVS